MKWNTLIDREQREQWKNIHNTITEDKVHSYQCNRLAYQSFVGLVLSAMYRSRGMYHISTQLN